MTIGEIISEGVVIENKRALVSAMKLKQLLGFDCVLKNDVLSSDCKNMKRTYATLTFDIAGDNGQVVHRVLEVTLDELKQFKAEMQRVEETLH